MEALQTIPHQDCIELLRVFDVGSPIAENDVLLNEARVETAVFAQLLCDSVDIIRGTKGSGKSALYRLFTTYLLEWLRNNHSVAVIRGIEVTGDPIFLKFRNQFVSFDQVAFQNFWRIYFLSLVNTQFISSPAYETRLSPAKPELKDYKNKAKLHGFPLPQSLLTPDGLVSWVLAKMPKSKVKVTLEPDGGLSGSVEFRDAPEVNEEPVPLFIQEIHDALARLLAKTGLRLWIMLDRLDEVFPRRSKVETVALRALLKTTTSFDTPWIRLKLFLRDDIFDSITEAPGGFPALTHVMSRCSSTLKWDKEQILRLIVNRVCANQRMASYFRISKEQLDQDVRYREQVFYGIFPSKLRRGKNQSGTLDWLYKHCEDGNGVVTPRDVIDLIKMATAHQTDACLAQATDWPSLLSSQSVLKGYQDMSTRKKETYLKAEFDHYWPVIEKFENRKAEHDHASLARLLGPEWRRTVRDLESIGFLTENPRAGTYSIPFLYRHCLNVRQGRATAAGGARR